MKDYSLVKSKVIVENHENFVEECRYLKDKFSRKFEGQDPTFSYREYNVFAATAPSPIWWDLFKDVHKVIRHRLPHAHRLWMQSWLNFQKHDEVLNWHSHSWPYHGYICIEPQETTTVFEEYEIKNEVGNIYFGSGFRPHKVRNDTQFEGIRITLGFDVCLSLSRPYEQWSLMPIL